MAHRVMSKKSTIVTFSDMCPERAALTIQTEHSHLFWAYKWCQKGRTKDPSAVTFLSFDSTKLGRFVERSKRQEVNINIHININIQTT